MYESAAGTSDQSNNTTPHKSPEAVNISGFASSPTCPVTPSSVCVGLLPQPFTATTQ